MKLSPKGVFFGLLSYYSLVFTLAAIPYWTFELFLPFLKGLRSYAYMLAEIPLSVAIIYVSAYLAASNAKSSALGQVALLYSLIQFIDYLIFDTGGSYPFWFSVATEVACAAAALWAAYRVKLGTDNARLSHLSSFIEQRIKPYC